MGKLTKICFYLGLCFVFTNVMAETAENSGEMQVSITNNTGMTCQLSDQALKHGVFISLPQQSITSGNTGTFSMQQSLMGPDVVLTYKCANNTITFEVQQDYSLIRGHTPDVTIVANDGMTLDKEGQSSSVSAGTAGVALITFRDELQ